MGSGSEGPIGTGSGSGGPTMTEPCEDCYEGVKVKNGKKTCTCDFCFTYLGFDILDVTAECDKKCSGKLNDIEEMIVNPCGDVPTGTGSGSEGPTGTGSGSGGPTVTEPCEDCYEGVKVKNGKKTCTCDFCFTYLGFDILDVTAECDKKCSGKLKDIEVGDTSGNTFMVIMDVKKGKADVTDIQ